MSKLSLETLRAFLPFRSSTISGENNKNSFSSRGAKGIQKPLGAWVTPIAIAAFGASGIAAVYFGRDYFSKFFVSPIPIGPSPSGDPVKPENLIVPNTNLPNANSFLRQENHIVPKTIENRKQEPQQKLKLQNLPVIKEQDQTSFNKDDKSFAFPNSASFSECPLPVLPIGNLSEAKPRETVGESQSSQFAGQDSKGVASQFVIKHPIVTGIAGISSLILAFVAGRRLCCKKKIKVLPLLSLENLTQLRNFFSLLFFELPNGSEKLYPLFGIKKEGEDEFLSKHVPRILKAQGNQGIMSLEDASILYLYAKKRALTKEELIALLHRTNPVLERSKGLPYLDEEKVKSLLNYVVKISLASFITQNVEQKCPKLLFEEELDEEEGTHFSPMLQALFSDIPMNDNDLFIKLDDLLSDILGDEKPKKIEEKLRAINKYRKSLKVPDDAPFRVKQVFEAALSIIEGGDEDYRDKIHNLPIYSLLSRTMPEGISEIELPLFELAGWHDLDGNLPEVAKRCFGSSKICTGKNEFPDIRVLILKYFWAACNLAKESGPNALTGACTLSKSIQEAEPTSSELSAPIALIINWIRDIFKELRCREVFLADLAAISYILNSNEDDQETVDESSDEETKITSPRETTPTLKGSWGSSSQTDQADPSRPLVRPHLLYFKPKQNQDDQFIEQFLTFMEQTKMKDNTDLSKFKGILFDKEIDDVDEEFEDLEKIYFDLFCAFEYASYGKDKRSNEPVSTKLSSLKEQIGKIKEKIDELPGKEIYRSRLLFLCHWTENLLGVPEARPELSPSSAVIRHT